MTTLLSKPPLSAPLVRIGKPGLGGTQPPPVIDQQWSQWFERLGELVHVLADPPMGSICTSVVAETTINTQSVFEKIAGTTVMGTSMLRHFDMPTNNRLRYIGLDRRHMHIVCTISMTTANNNKQTEFQLFYFDDSAGSGAVQDSSKTIRHVSTGADVGSTALHWDVIMSTNDYLELYGTNNTDSTNVTVEWMYLFAMGMIAQQ